MANGARETLSREKDGCLLLAGFGIHWASLAEIHGAGKLQSFVTDDVPPSGS